MIHELWDKLGKITQVEFSSTCRMIPPSYDQRTGQGKVIIQSRDADSIVFFEKGKWQGVQSADSTAFTNVFRWKIDEKENRLSLEHLRLGANHPVFLFHLNFIGDKSLRSLQPHECKEDTYMGSVLFDKHFVHLDWRIIGPKKNEIIRLVYR